MGVEKKESLQNMANVDYAVHFTQAADGVGVVVFRTPSTVPVDGTTGSSGNRLTIPRLMDDGGGVVETTIVSATAATPIVATVTTGDGALFTNGDLWTVSGGTGDTNINGTFFITVSSDAVTLVGSKTDGTYDANTATIRKVTKAKSYHIALAAAMAAILNDKAVQG